jgi:signal transduction histidine kinase
MVPFSSLTLLLNGLTLALSLSFLLITLWQDTRKELSQFFALFLFMVTLWNIGSLLLQASLLINGAINFKIIASRLIELGYIGSCITIYTLTTVIVGAHTRKFRLLAFSSLLIILSYQIISDIFQLPIYLEQGAFDSALYQIQPLSALFYLFFDGLTVYLIWNHRRKIRSNALHVGILLFVSGQSLSLLNPELQTLAASINLSSLAALIISFALLRQEVIAPLADRIRQIEAMHQVSLAITSQISLSKLLEEIAMQAAGWLDADGSGIFFLRSDKLELVTVFNLPAQFISTTLQVGEGMAGTVAQTSRSIFVENFPRDWKGQADLPFARETFGSVICVPLIYGGQVLGVLMVISGQQGRLFDADDVHLLELLGAQAAVAIAHSQLFADQQILIEELDSARSQLETVLVSTQNPVVAVDRQMKLIFANPAAQALFSLNHDEVIMTQLPSHAMPPSWTEAARNLRRYGTHIYEIALNSRIFQCHLAVLGRPATTGWVAILNDVTQLKELDRLKSEMVRMTSHDLKNPLQAAMANLELLSDDLADIDNQEIQESIVAIDKQLERMNRIIGGILDLERVKSGILVTEICRPDRIIHNAVDELQHLADDKNITLLTDIAPQTLDFLGDQEQFERALINLVENAIKFTPSGGTVTVHVHSDDNAVLFEVSDTGIGIPVEIHEKIFERFFRGRQKGADHVSGSGLGLSLVKAIVENHHGHIWLTSSEGCGTTFFVKIPAVNVERILS